MAVKDIEMKMVLHFGKDKPKKSGRYMVLHQCGENPFLTDCEYSAKWQRFNAYDGLPTAEYAFKDSDVLAWAELEQVEKMVRFENVRG